MPGPPMRVTGPQEFAAALRELERTFPVEVDAMLTGIAESVVPAIREHTPVGDGRSGQPGRLRDATRVTKVKGRPGFVNAQRYANTIHWGRLRRGVVRGVRFVTRAVEANRALIEQEMTNGLNKLFRSRLP